MSVLSSFGFSMKDEYCDIPYCIGNQNYTIINANNGISQELISVVPSLFLKY
jgi:hypothetical protein